MCPNRVCFRLFHSAVTLEGTIAYEVWQGDVPIKMGVIMVSAENIDEARKRARTISDDVLTLMFPGARIVITDDLNPHATGL